VKKSEVFYKMVLQMWTDDIKEHVRAHLLNLHHSRNGRTERALICRDVKLKRSLVQILCGLATFDNAFLVLTFFMFTMPCLSERWVMRVYPA